MLFESMFFWLFKICALSILHRVSFLILWKFARSSKYVKSYKLRYVSWNDEIKGGEINPQRTMNNILMASQSRSATCDAANIHRGFLKNHNFLLFTISKTFLISKINSRMRILFWSRRFPPVLLGHVTEVNYLGERDWENAALGKPHPVSNSNLNSCMRNEQWLFDVNSSFLLLFSTVCLFLVDYVGSKVCGVKRTSMKYNIIALLYSIHYSCCKVGLTRGPWIVES